MFSIWGNSVSVEKILDAWYNAVSVGIILLSDCG